MFFVLLFLSEPFVTKQTMLKLQSFKISVVVSASLLTFYIVQKLFDIEKDDILGSSGRSREILVDVQEIIRGSMDSMKFNTSDMKSLYPPLPSIQNMKIPTSNNRWQVISFRFSLGVIQQTTWTEFCHFFTPLHPAWTVFIPWA